MKSTFIALAITTALTSASTAMAQTTPVAAPVAPVGATSTSTQDTSTTDIVVTARREQESLQSVPVSIQVVTGDAINKLSITQATEISKLAPGLTLSTDGESTGTKIVLRGVAWQPGSGTPATPIYLNEVPFDPYRTIQGLFDIGQIEVLRGPQGTTRGAPSISGAVTITTRRPDLEEFGGYVQGQYGSGDHSDFQGAINIPIIKDVLAIRAAVNLEDSEGNRVFSVNSAIKPKYRDRIYRITALFKPTDTISIEAMYQRADQLTHSYTQVVGPGSPGFAEAGIPANFNGPALTASNYKSVQDAPTTNPSDTDLITLNASWEVLGHTLTYNFGREIDHSGTSTLSLDPSNMLPGYEPLNYTSNVSTPYFQTQEIRLSSLRDESRPFDYDIGWFSRHSKSPLNFAQPVFFTGAFGAPGTLPGVVTTPVSRYVLQTSTDIEIDQAFDSFYGSVRVYLDHNTELSGGMSVVHDRVPVSLDVTTAAAATVAAPLSELGGLPCAGIPGIFVTGLVDSIYPGFCDANIPAGVGNSIQNYNTKYSKVLYNASLSHKFTDDLMVYGTTGTSYRSGLPAIDNIGLPANLLIPQPETATSYEVGVKSSFGRRLRINADVFQINYKNQLTPFSGIPYFNTVSGQATTTSAAFYGNVNARVRGVELEIAAKPTRDLALDANVSYSKISSRGGQVPCNNGTAVTAANPINFCASPSGETLNTQAPFQATVNGSYDIPLNAKFDGYFRFNVNFQGNNPNYGNFPVAGGFTKTSAYAIVDLFAGLTQHASAWDLGVYAKNVFDLNKELNRGVLLNNVYPAFEGAPNGYSSVLTTTPREIGVTLRVALGSR